LPVFASEVSRIRSLIDCRCVKARCAGSEPSTLQPKRSICAYCGTESSSVDGRCSYCGAPKASVVGSVGWVPNPNVVMTF
jgi:predicted amidophosphoribosyltransferase